MNDSNRRVWMLNVATGAVSTVASYARANGLRRIGVLGMTSATGYAARWGAFRQGLGALGWLDGKQVEFVERFADGQLERLPGQAAELISAKVDVIVTHGIPGARAARQATQTVPIVVAAIADPVTAGLVASFARPGGNITGMAFLAQEMAAKRMQLLKVALPGATRVAALSNPRNPMFSQAMFEAMQGAAAPLKLTLQRFEVADESLFGAVLAEVGARGQDAVVLPEEAMFNAHVKELAALALKHRIPAVGTKDFCDAGGLVGYGADFNAMFERAAHMVDRVLRGARPGDLPIEQPTRFELAANLRTAHALGIALPKLLTMRADVLIR